MKKSVISYSLDLKPVLLKNRKSAVDHTKIKPVMDLFKEDKEDKINSVVRHIVHGLGELKSIEKKNDHIIVNLVYHKKKSLSEDVFDLPEDVYDHFDLKNEENEWLHNLDNCDLIKKGDLDKNLYTLVFKLSSMHFNYDNL